MHSGAPIDDAVLRMLRDRAATHPLVERVRVEWTDTSISVVVAELEADRYPDSVENARLEIQWYLNGDYNFHYVETHVGDTVWQCRWDRHQNPHTARTHFHPPPGARSEAAVPDNPENTPPTELFTRTLATVRQRLDELWAETGE